MDCHSGCLSSFIIQKRMLKFFLFLVGSKARFTEQWWSDSTKLPEGEGTCEGCPEVFNYSILFSFIIFGLIYVRALLGAYTCKITMLFRETILLSLHILLFCFIPDNVPASFWLLSARSILFYSLPSHLSMLGIWYQAWYLLDIWNEILINSI